MLLGHGEACRAGMGVVGTGEKKSRTWELPRKSAKVQKGTVHVTRDCAQAATEQQNSEPQSHAPSTFAPLHFCDSEDGSTAEPDADVL